MPSKGNQEDSIPHTRKEARPDFSKPLPREKLPRDLQDLVDRDDSFWDDLKDGYTPETTDSSLRYAAYATRIRTILLSAHRYVAYTSDVGESFRPVAHPRLVRSAYAISWAYLTGDVALEGYKAWCRNQRVLNPLAAAQTEAEKAGKKLDVGLERQLGQLGPGKVPALEDWRSVMVERAAFQGIASMGLPAFTIHSIVRYSGRALKDAKNKTIRTWGPIGLGLAAVPFLPYIFDEPVEKAIEWTFYNGYKLIGGEAAVGSRKLHKPVPLTATASSSSKDGKGGAPQKEKEL